MVPPGPASRSSGSCRGRIHRPCSAAAGPREAPSLRHAGAEGTTDPVWRTIRSDRGLPASVPRRRCRLRRSRGFCCPPRRAQQRLARRPGLADVVCVKGGCIAAPGQIRREQVALHPQAAPWADVHPLGEGLAGAGAAHTDLRQSEPQGEPQHRSASTLSLADHRREGPSRRAPADLPVQAQSPGPYVHILGPHVASDAHDAIG